MKNEEKRLNEAIEILKLASARMVQTVGVNAASLMLAQAAKSILENKDYIEGGAE